MAQLQKQAFWPLLTLIYTLRFPNIGPLLLLLSDFSRVQFCETPETAAHQAPPSLGFSRQEHWSGLPFLLQCMKVKSESEVAQSYPTLSDPMNCNLPGSSIHGNFQARVLECVAIAFSRGSNGRGEGLIYMNILFLLLYLICSYSILELLLKMHS